MKRKSWYLVVFITWCYTNVVAYNFHDGMDHHYVYSSESEILGKTNVTVVSHLSVRIVNTSEEGTRLNRLKLDSISVHQGHEFPVENPRKWNLSTNFFFTMDKDGLIDFVHCHKEDEIEAIYLKKAIVSIFSAKSRTLHSGSVVTFTNVETDHSGQLEHSYQIFRSAHGQIVHRIHQSNGHYHRTHNKSLAYDRNGVLQKATSRDHVSLYSQTEKATSTRTPIKGEYIIQDTSSGDLPNVFSSFATSHLRLEKTSVVTWKEMNQISDQYIRDTILIKQPEEEVKTLKEINSTISSLISCILEPNSTSNSSVEPGCVDDLWHLLGSLQQVDFRNLMEQELESGCTDNDTYCTRRSGLFVDMLCRRADGHSQPLITTLVLKSPRTSEEEMQRCLFHLAALQKPSIGLMRAVEDLCMGENDSFTEVVSLSDTQRRSCLSLGALVKNLKLHHASYADLVTVKLERWLNTKGQDLEESEDTADIGRGRNKHIITKMTLLHALGNAGMNRSLSHITSFMEPNTGPSELRRAAVASLKHYTCNKSADSLLHVVLHDDNRQVKKEAYEAFLSHPNKGKLTVPQKDDILTTNYTYPTLLRLKRGVISKNLKDGFYFGITLPGIHWQKVIGNSAIGAEFGMTLRNNLELELKFLSGHFEIDVYNAAFAELNLKLLNTRYTLLDAKMCYMGHIRYDINILKEFGINDIKDLANLFDEMSATVVDPVVNAVNAFKNVMNFLKDGGMEKLFHTVASLLRNLPTILGQVVLKFIEHMKTLYQYGGVPWIDHLKRVVNKIRTFISDIQEDAMGFYQKTIDAVTITLPYIGKKLVGSLKKIIAAITSFLTSPLQSVASLAKGLLDVKLSIGMFMDFKTIMMETLLKNTGKNPFWQSYGNELEDIIEEIKSFVTMVTASAQTPSGSEDGDSTRLSDCITDMVEQMLWSKKELKRVVFDSVNETFFSSEFGKDIFENIKDVIDMYKSLKSSYTSLKSYVQKSIALVQRVFGPKFHNNFPNRRRPEVSGCGQGVWPTTSNNAFQTTGVDVILGYGKKLVSPVNGLVFKESSSRIRIKPTDDGLSDFEIIIENAEADDDTISNDGTFAEAGETIATALKSSCDPNFIHVSVRKTASEEFQSDNDFTYIDPSKFLDKLMPIPKWVLECKDFHFKHVFQTVDIGNLGAYFMDLYSDIKRTVMEKIDELSQLTTGDISFEIEFGNSFLETETSDGSILDTLKQSLPDFGNVMKLYSLKGITDGLNILKLVDMGGFTLQKVHSMLDRDLQLNLDLMIDKLRMADVDISTQDPSTLSMSQLQDLFKELPHDIYGDWQSTVHEAILKYEMDCPNFKGVVGKGVGLICRAREDCRGLSCAVPLNIGIIHPITKLDISLDPCSALLYITDISMTTAVKMDGETHTVTLPGTTVLGTDSEPYVLTLAIQGEEENGVMYFSVEGALCVKCHASCLQPFIIVSDARVDIPNNCNNSESEDGIVDALMQMTWRDFLDSLSQIGELDGNTSKIADSIRMFILETLVERSFSAAYTQAISSAFPNAKDTCSVDEKRLPLLNGNFFELKVSIPVGPIFVEFEFSVGGSLGVSVGIDVCVVSMYAKGVVKPSLALRIKGSVGIKFLIFKGGITLEGLFMHTKFPITVTYKFNKFPIDISKKLDLELVPVTLILQAFLEIDLWLFSKTIFSAVIWRYDAPTIRRNIFTIEDKEPDADPPVIDSPVTFEISGVAGCNVVQVKNRSPLDTEFLIEVSASDPVSDVHMFYAIGTTPGTIDVTDWTEYTGPLLVIPTTDLPNSVPLYWTVKARNSQGLEVYTMCHLDTYDNTAPDGRVDASFAFSSHPSILSGTVTVFDDSELKTPHYKAVGYSSGRYGYEVRDWEEMPLNYNNPRSNEPSDLKYFSIPKPGKLTVASFESSKTTTALLCAQICLRYNSKCVAFDYEYHTENCDLHSVVEGHQAKRRISGTYANYERLNIGSTTYVSYTDLPLVHGFTYFINFHVTNILGYQSYLKSSGTIVDFTPPDTGSLGEDYNETVHADRCHAALTQRCIDVTDLLNHRIVRDGKNAQTVFNGHISDSDLLYSLANHYLTVNFGGFHDDETGIWGYTWSAGKTICGSDVVRERDPHGHLSHTKYWTHTGYAKDLYLSDGEYYVTVSALNNVVYGGALVTTVCHTTPIVIDTTPPVFQRVSSVYFDEDFDILAIYYSAFDEDSKLKLVEFGLGKTKHDVTIRSYSEFPLVTGDDPFVGVEDFNLSPGVYAWIRLRVENNVGLFTSGHGDDPIMIDRTAPLAGVVNDGAVTKSDIRYQYETTAICANWLNFYDPESGISKFKWGVGTAAGLDDIISFRNLTHHERHVCSTGVSLQHNVTYFSTVFAYNSALNQKFVNSSSDGVLIDVTSPDAGWLHDGLSFHGDIQFTSSSASKSCYWNNFTDAESDVDHYEVSVFVNNELRKTFVTTNNSNTLTDYTVSMDHSDVVYWKLTAYNGAGLETDVNSDGFLVDHTAPVMEYIRDTELDSKYQSNNSRLDISWKVSDLESGISHHSFYIQEKKHGSKSRFWPTEKQSEVIYESTGTMALLLDDLSLQDGAMYSVKVISTNNALLSTHHESPGVIIDTTAPVMSQVLIGVAGEDEDMDENGNIVHVENAPLRVNWFGFDSDSAITNYYLGVGTEVGEVSLTEGIINMHQDVSVVLENLDMKSFELSQKKYYVTIYAKNGAGLLSNSMSSKPIVLVEENVPGSVNDGFEDYTDFDIDTDKRSISMSFNDFRSAACNILKYEWAVGSEPYFSDILPYTDFGIVLQNATFGHGQINVRLIENIFYYTTVRATTGYGCHEQYILSSSDGFKIDSTNPTILSISPRENDTDTINDADNIFQRTAESPLLYWRVLDSSQITSMKWAAGSLPYQDNLHILSETSNTRLQLGDLSISSGETLWVYVIAEDAAGNIGRALSSPLTSDITSPLINGLNCDPTISTKYGRVSCTWDVIEEFESKLKCLEIGIGTSESQQDIMPYTAVHYEKQDWFKDIQTEISNLLLTEIYVSFRVLNILNSTMDYVVKVDIDSTPPMVESLLVTTSMKAALDGLTTPTSCQIPTSYVEISLGAIEDTESLIKRLEVSLSTDIGEEDILPYTEIQMPIEDPIFIGHLSLQPGTHVYVKARVHNSAGMYNTVISDPIKVSQSPKLVIHDGISGIDRDVQREIHKLDGEWYYSGQCQVREVEWSILDSTGAVVQHFQTLPDTGGLFYNDELLLNDGITYTNVLKVTDYLNRTIEDKSDGITVYIQPPSPGYVRDGLDEDIDYQLANDHLSGNWDEFGDQISTDPTQLISHYEVAIGNDVRYSSMTANVHYFVNTGLDTYITFNSLNLTKRTVVYHITVRAYSLSGSYAEAYSNGIQVGYQDGIEGGEVSNERHQQETNQMSFSWSGFKSDIGLNRFYVGIASTNVPVTNKTFNIEQLTSFANICDIFPLTDVNEDMFFTSDKLTLLHGQRYQPVVVAVDNAGDCKVVVGENVLVDTTSPLTSGATLLVNGRLSSTYTYIDSSDTISVDWKNISDPESGILSYTVTVYAYYGCNGTGDDNQKVYLKSMTVSSETQVNFRSMNLATDQNYVIGIEAVNNAGLSGFAKEVYFRVDASKPMKGTIKITDNWLHENAHQSSHTSMTVWVAIARSAEAFTCPSQSQLIPNDANSVDWFEDSVCDNECVYISNNLLRIKIGYNIALTSIDAGCISSEDIILRKGKYIATMNIAKGTNTITSFFIGTSQRAVSIHLTPPIPDDFSSVIDGYDFVTGDTSNTTSSSNGTVRDVETAEIVSEEENIGVHGCGVSIIGERQANSSFWDGLFWCVDTYGRNKQWFQLENDPTDRRNSFTIRLLNKESGTWKLDLLINGKQEAVLSGITLPLQVRIYFHTETNNDYIYTKDPFDPFQAHVTITEVSIPTEIDSLCQHGQGFFDNESGIQSIWLGVSDGLNEAVNISPLENMRTFCEKCTDKCSVGCDENCSFISDYELYSFKLSNLQLQSAVIAETESTVTVQNDTTYYAVAKLIDFAGNEIISYSNGIIVDVTPPVCELIKCIDPAYSSTEETDFIGTDRMIGAYWTCSEEISELQETIVNVSCIDDGLTVYPNENIGLQSSFNIELPNETYFEDKKHYRFNMKISNTAGLSSFYSCDVTALFYPPNTDSLHVTSLFNAVTDNNASAVEWIHNNDRIGISWTNDGDTVEFYEWTVGTAPGEEDIIPLSIIGGNSTSSSFYIINNQIWIDGVVAEWTLADLANPSTTNQYNVSGAAPMLLMEPGRCLYITLLVLGPSHLTSAQQQTPICIARNNDTILNSTTQTQMVVRSIGSAMTTLQVENGTESDLIVNFTDFYGDAVVGRLTDADMMATYGSASSATFLSFISNPYSTHEITSRMLTNRIYRFLGQSFFISPTQSYQFFTMSVMIRVNSTFDTNTKPVLAVWITNHDGKGYWDVVDQSCAVGSYEMDNYGYIVFKVCGSILSSTSRRKKRGTGETVSTPLQFSVFLMNETYSNTAPVLETRLLTMDEDDYINTTQLVWSDLESDSVTFNISSIHRNDAINVTADGKLSFTPSPHYTGVFQVHLILQETTPDAENMETNDVLEIEVINLNDAPVLLFTDLDGFVFDSRQIQNTTLFRESNNTHYDLGTLVVFDFDDNDTFVFLEMAKQDGQITNETTMFLQRHATSPIVVDVSDSEYIKQSSHASVSVSSHNNITGEIHFHFRVHDREVAYSHEFVSVVYFLFNPCVHGSCGTVNVNGPPCNSTLRSVTFEPYYCVCEKGYEGNWCQEEINECVTIGCSWMHHCTDKIGYVECTINYSKLVPITIVFFLAIVALAVGIRIFGRKICHKSIDVDGFESQSNFAFEDMEEDPSLKQAARPPIATVFPNPQNKKPIFNGKLFRLDLGEVDFPKGEFSEPDQRFLNGPKEDKKIFRDEPNMGSFGSLQSGPFLVRHAWLETPNVRYSQDQEDDTFDEDEDKSSSFWSSLLKNPSQPPTYNSYPLPGTE